MIMRRFPLFVILMVLLSGVTVSASIAEDKPIVHALLVIMDGDPNNFKQYEANERRVMSLLRRVKNKTVCELELTTLRSNARVATDLLPTPKMVLDWIAALSPQRNDAIFIYYCGPGGSVPEEADGGFYFDLDGAELSRKTIVDQLKASPAAKCRLKMLITDTSAVEAINIETPDFSNRTSAASSYNAARAYTQLFVEHEGFLNLTSTAENEYAWGDSTNGGWFTNALVASINSHPDAAARFVGWNEIFTATQKKVTDFITRNSERVGGKIQHPKHYGEFPKPLRHPSDLAKWAGTDDRQSPQGETQKGTQIRKIDLALTEVTDEMPLQRLQVYIQFAADDLTDAEVKVQAYFFHQDGRILKDADAESEKRYGTVNGQVSIGDQVKTAANETTLFIPISQLHLPRGEHPLEIVAVIRSLSGEELVRSMKSFELTRR